MREIKSRIGEFEEVSFIHERREVNGKAHRLARTATTLDYGRRVWFITSPTGVGIAVNSLLID